MTRHPCSCPTPPPPDGPFCRECGGVSGPKPEALAAYRVLFERCAIDGIIDQDEGRHLASRRQQLGVSLAHHQALMEELGVFDGRPLALSCAEHSLFYTPGAHAVLRLGLTNLRPERDAILQRVEAWITEPVTHRLRRTGVPIAQGGPDPQRVHSLQLSWDAPERGGHLHVEGRLHCQFLDDRDVWMEFDIEVEPKAPTAAAPQAMHLHLDARNAAMVDNIHLGAPTPAPRSSTGLTTWQPVEHARLCRAADARHWLNEPGRRTHAAEDVPRGPTVQGRAHRCRAILLQITPSPQARPLELWLLAGPAATFGRDGARADLVLAVEPYTVPANHAASMRISSRHLGLRLDAAGALVEDLGSMNGTTLEGRPLPARSPQALRGPTALQVAGALALRAEPLLRPGGAPYALRLHRVDNQPHRTYLIAPEGLVLRPGASDPFGPPPEVGAAEAPLRFVWHEGSPALLHSPPTELRRGGSPLLPGRGVYLEPGQVYSAGGLILEVTDELLPAAP